MCGYDVVATEDGKKAMDELRNEENNFDLILAEGVLYTSDKANITELVLKNLRSK